VGLAVIAGLVTVSGFVPIGFYFYIAGGKGFSLHPLLFFFLILSAIFVVPGVFAFRGAAWAVSALRWLAVCGLIGCIGAVIGTLAGVGELESVEVVIRVGAAGAVGAVYLAALRYLGSPAVENYMRR
jgi:hypothetical protein